MLLNFPWSKRGPFSQPWQKNEKRKTIDAAIAKLNLFFTSTPFLRSFYIG